MTKKPKLKSDQLTYLHIENMGADIACILEQYHTKWMPLKLKKPYEKMIKDAYNLYAIAGDLAGVDIEV